VNEVISRDNGNIVNPLLLVSIHLSGSAFFLQHSRLMCHHAGPIPDVETSNRSGISGVAQRHPPSLQLFSSPTLLFSKALLFSC
jgi:hypothetical protein